MFAFTEAQNKTLSRKVVVRSVLRQTTVRTVVIACISVFSMSLTRRLNINCVFATIAVNFFTEQVSRKQGAGGAFALEDEVDRDLPFARTCTHTVSRVLVHVPLLFFSFFFACFFQCALSSTSASRVDTNSCHTGEICTRLQ